MNKLERRIFSASIEMRADDDKPGQLVGHAAVFDKETNIGGWFREKIAPGAFRNAIGRDDVRALFNHDPNFVLGRTSAGTLKLKEDKVGLLSEINPPDTQTGRDVRTLIERGDVNQMSFGFIVKAEEWIDGEEGELDLRVIKDVELWDVSPVTFPAYAQTDISARSIDAYKEHEKQRDEAKRRDESRLKKYKARAASVKARSI